MSVNEDFINIIAEYTKPTTSWAALKKAYQEGSQSQILTLVDQLQTLKLAEGASAEEYVTKAWEIKNQLKSMDEL
jgi:hypothetical protein